MVTGLEMDTFRLEGEKVKALNLIARILNEHLTKMNKSLEDIEIRLENIEDSLTFMTRAKIFNE